MTYVYISRKDGKWARYDFGDISEVEDFWYFIDQISPELWNALPETAEFSENQPSEYETFSHIDDLVAWADEPNHGQFLVTGDLPYDSEDFEARFDSIEDAIDYAEEEWYSLSEDDRDTAKIAVFRLSDMEMVWNHGFM